MNDLHRDAVRLGLVSVLVAAVAAVIAGPLKADGAEPKRQAEAVQASPLYGVTVPQGYRQWQLVAPALEAGDLNELRAVLGNATAITAYRKGGPPFPDGTVLVKLAWKHVQSPEFATALVPGSPTTVQVMVKDSRRYAATGGWGFGRFVDGKPADLAQHQTCFACHAALVKDRDYVFTRLAP
ncbi:cytochrome P460 family protein [Pelomonas sp. KK5]|uniref:cytochrome P460 family protein n=1 Tax=Pelomonas sp. KK5 TaxID=1855730 RepID=UPI00097C664B|nr:cytochrome P460 family protein [Pelomonas sp. KK5]